MAEQDILQQIQFASDVVGHWPSWKQNILSRSSRPDNTVARSPVDNQAALPGVREARGKEVQESAR
jgi:hypothetical protein